MPPEENSIWTKPLRDKLIEEIENLTAGRIGAKQALDEIDIAIWGLHKRGKIDDHDKATFDEDIATIRKELNRLHDFAKFLRQNPELATEMSYDEFTWTVGKQAD